MTVSKELRTKLNMSQEEFARAIRMSVGSVRTYDSGRKPPAPALSRMLMMATGAGFIELAARLEKAGAEPIPSESAVLERRVPTAADAPEERSALHVMLDFILDLGTDATASAVCETLRVYFQSVRSESEKELLDAVELKRMERPELQYHDALKLVAKERPDLDERRVLLGRRLQLPASPEPAEAAAAPPPADLAAQARGILEPARRRRERPVEGHKGAPKNSLIGD
jgi:transcriptional regulator with XRE-family HTH domain